MHIAIDAGSRESYAEVFPNEMKETTAAFLQRALSRDASQGVQVQCILTDNGKCYHSKLPQAVCEAHASKHSFTRPYHPRTNGKAERFTQTACGNGPTDWLKFPRSSEARP